MHPVPMGPGSPLGVPHPHVAPRPAFTCLYPLPAPLQACSEAASLQDGRSRPPQVAACVITSEDGQKSLPFAKRCWLPVSGPIFNQLVNSQRVMPRKVFAGSNTFSTCFFSIFYCVLVTQSSAKPKQVKHPPADFYCPKSLTNSGTSQHALSKRNLLFMSMDTTSTAPK